MTQKQVGTVTRQRLIETLDEFLSADNATQTESAVQALVDALHQRANVYRDATAEQLEMPERARIDYMNYFSTCASAVATASQLVRRIGEKLVMPA